GERHLRARFGSIEFGQIGAFPPWRVGERHVQLRAEADLVTIRVRRTALALDMPVVTPPWPEPTYIELAQACAHCDQVPERDRVLMDGSRVCVACGRSQPPDGVAARTASSRIVVQRDRDAPSEMIADGRMS